MTKDLPVLAFETQEAWETWLAGQPRDAPGVRLKLAKKGAGIPSVTHQEAIDSALCHGWIDGQANSVDETYWLLRFTPRRSRSKWSQVNCKKVLRLIEEGRVKPAGLAEVDRAKADGRWEAAYAPPSTATVPDDLAAAFEKNETARNFFETLDGTNRYAVLHRIHDAKKPETRARRIEKFVDMLARGETLHPMRTKRTRG